MSAAKPPAAADKADAEGRAAPDDLAASIQALDRDSAERALELKRAGQRFRWTSLLLRPPARFLGQYLLRGGFRHGIAGLVAAFTAAYGVFITYGKLWELEQRDAP